MTSRRQTKIKVLLLLLVLMAVGKPTKMVHSRHLLDRSVERIMFRKLDNNNTINSGGGDIKKIFNFYINNKYNKNVTK